MAKKTYKSITRFGFFVNLVKACFFAFLRKIVSRPKFKRKKYLGKRLPSLKEGNNLLEKHLLSDSPFAAARFGDGELRTIVCYLEKQLGFKKKYPDYVKKAICFNAGFFPCDEEQIDCYCELMLDSCSQIDCLAVWFNLLEDYIYSKFGPSTKKCIYLQSLESFWFEEPWTRCLEGKKVLIIHPFSETILEQYKNHKLLFKNDRVLPDFELIVFRAIQSIGGKNGQFKTWFDALEYMTNSIKQIDFDVALIGCGAYGLPLAAKIRSWGKKAIHLGGVTQFYFGIKGNRWDLKPEYSAFYNEYWCRPSTDERPVVSGEIENGCYW